MGVSAKVSYFERDKGSSYKLGGRKRFPFSLPAGAFCRLPVSVKKAETGVQTPSRQMTKMMTLDTGNVHALSSHANDAAVALPSQAYDAPLSVIRRLQCG